ncbi:MAG: methionine--tRNA ligase [Armatimonadetes bacterium]|nr:methionine--tRNA ligase [Armatimonadota bacterium]
MEKTGANGVFYVTTPIYYVNALPHIGHSYTTVAADVVARYRRLRGQRVLFATGTDEHGQKVFRSAQAQGKNPQAFVDEIAAAYQKAWKAFHIEYDAFIRTTNTTHVATVQYVFDKLRASGDIYPGEYEGWYCTACESSFREDELRDGNCPDCGRSVEHASQPAYFFRTSKYAERILRYLEDHPDFIIPRSRQNEVISFVSAGLRDACVSRRRTDWDIPVPDDDSQSIYVWFDALINYLTVAGYPDDPEKFAQVWPPDVQLMGKDILPRFHATLWPAMLMALDLPLPRQLVAHGWWVAPASDKTGLTKISKSKGNVIDPLQAAANLAHVSGADGDVAVDAIRYYMLREVTFGLDGVFSMDSVVDRFNADLANDLGNLLNRSLPLVHRFLAGCLPAPSGDLELTEDIEAARQACEQAMDQYDFSGALEALWALVRRANKFLDERAPWNLHKAGHTEAAGQVLYEVADVARCVALGIAPFMPYVAAEIWRQLGLEETQETMRWQDFAPGRTPAHTAVGEPRPIFPRIDVNKLQQAEVEQKARQEKSTEGLVTLAEFARVDLRAGKVLAAERIPKADKLLKLIVDVGEDQPREIVAGLAPRFQPEDLVGLTVVVVANLEPATIRGARSQGMVLAAGAQEPVAMVVLSPDCPPGTKVR